VAIIGVVMMLLALRELASRFRTSRLSTRILILSTLISVVPMVLLTSLIGQSNTDANHQAGQHMLQGEAVTQAAEIGAQVGTWKTIARRLSQDPAVTAAAQGGSSPAGDTARDALVREQRLVPGAQVLAVADRGGHVIITTDPALLGNPDFSHSSEFLQARNGKVVISNVTVGRGLSTPRIHVAAPIAAPDGGFVGAVIVRVDDAAVVGFQNPTRLPGERFGMVVDRNNVVVGYNGPSPGRVLYRALGRTTPAQLLKLQRTGLYGSQPVQAIGMDELSRRLMAGGAGAAQVPFPITGRAVEAGYAQLAGLPWTVVVMEDEAAFAAALPSPFLIISLSFVCLAILITVAIYFVTRMLENTESQALNDDLTGLPNRRYFAALMTREMERSRRNLRPLSVVMVDLDHFKRVNDQHGHRAGDEVLRVFAAALLENVRATDVAARYGGEEFVILLPDTEKEGALLLVEKLRQVVESLDIDLARISFAGRGGPLKITLSAGVATLPADAEDEEAVVRRADQALYLAKAMGRNQVIGFGSALPLADLAEDPEKVSLLIGSANRSTVEALAAAIDARDSATRGHSRRVAEYATLIGRELGLGPSELETLSLGALLHDLGKIGISDEVLNKGGTLTDDEFTRVSAHTTIGHRMVEGVPFLRQVAPIILHHHENVDGSGYPAGMAGGDIPLAARIVKVADSFDAMTTQRAYRGAAPVESALGELGRHAGKQFDDEVVAALVAALDRNKVKQAPAPAQAPATATG
jgi:diguanylate cyclase (GGDEF)-like protein/putative nucleotidyltransferase with HDIG domain